jgi:hypothetical protein
MKLHAGNNVIEKSGNFEESKFSIEASSKAFFILSDGLYSNKILAVVRELSTNAYDSHVDAGKRDVAFDVHLPTALNPVFFIRDYGTSMDHENCMQLYTTYFRSTRNNSNDAVGCLGLGSKAPFAYADSFTVEAYLDGKQRIYNAYKNEDGSPVFSLMHENDTTEPNGIKVSIQVNSNDVNRFNAEASKVYEFFKVKPNFIGEKISFRKIDKVLAGDGWYFDDNADNNLIIMGQIAYPVDHFQIMGDGDNKEARFIQYSDGLRIFVNIGDVDITPSRESLSYSKDTKINIKSIVNRITSEIASKIEDQTKSQPSLYKARIKYVQISDQCSSIKNAIESLQKSITWNGQKLFDNIINKSINVKDKLSLTFLSKSSYRKKINSSKDVEFVNFTGDMKVFVDDLNRGGLSRIKKFMREDQRAYGDEQKCYVYKLKDGETVDNNGLYDILGGATKDDVVLTSSLPKITYDRTNSGSSDGLPPVHIQVFNEETGQFEVCNMSVKYENAYYFTESKCNITIGYKDMSENYIASTLSFMHKYYPDDVDGMTFYAVKPSVIKNRKLAERSNWSDAISVMRTVFNKAVADHKQDIIDCNVRCGLSAHKNEKFANIFSATKTDNEAKKVVAEYNEYEKRCTSMRHEMEIVRAMSTIIPNCNSVDLSSAKIDNTKFSKRFDDAVQKYPMLKVIANMGYYGGVSQNDVKIVVDYIDTIESAENMSNILSRI